MYDIIVRMPLIVWAPGLFEGGKKLDGLCQQMDIAPTLLELAGAQIPEMMEAQSLLPALRGESWNGRDYVFAEHPRDGILQTTEFMSMVRARDWKLVHFLGEQFGQLFDLAEDPGEVRNLWDDPSAVAKKQDLLHMLLEWRIRSQYHTRNLSKEWR
jgi:arylsulfatase A-like enzyme